ncbi:Transferase [Trema orientale]|uniref:Transferase n=1 Tax=Trema orientale TaxID=63057 RepID=A0A2P5B412_TREOI|nr:Transferase [Trema orientale]
MQVTYFKCGGVSLGVAIDHHIVDGFSGVHFINSWSETARGHELTLQPFLDRTLLRARNPPQLVFDRTEYQSPHDQEMKASQENSESQYATESITVANFEITKEQLNILKAEANDTSVHEDGNTIRYSTFHVLAAHIWKCACIARGIRDDQECRLYFAVSGRNSRLQPPLPMGYFGNAFCRAVSVVVAGDLKSKPIWYSASSIHKTLARMDSDFLRSTIDYLELQSDILAARYGPHLHMSPNLTITSWVRFSGHDTDFGWGQPLYIGPGDLTEGKSYIFGDARKDGSLRVAIALQSSHMEVFKELFFKDCKISATTFFQ